MNKRFNKKTRGVQTDAEAIIFIGCDENPFEGDGIWGYAACIFTSKEVVTLNKASYTSKKWGEKIWLYKAVDLALDYCKQYGIKSADIIYDANEELVSDLASIDEEKPWTCMEETKTGELKIKYGSMDVRLYREQKGDINRPRLIGALHRNADRAWLQQQDPIEMFLILTEELALAATEGEKYTADVRNSILEAASIKTMEAFGTQQINQKTNGRKETKRTMKRKNPKTIMDLVLKYGMSIKKETMTSFHLIYGFACICQLETTELCQRLGLDESHMTKMSYVKNKLISVFKSGKLEMDTAKLVTIIPQYIEQLEQDIGAQEDYAEAIKIVNEWEKIASFPQEVIAYSALYRLLGDDQTFNVSGLNTVYLKYNQEFMLEKNGIKKTDRYVSNLEELAQTSTKLYDTLHQKIVGQDFAIEKFVQGYINAKLATNQKKEKPAASYLFAGPPGVGKTYLARSSAEVLNMPVKILDMSEYADEHSANGLVGFEKTWKGSIPGILTTFVAENPASIILVDEIEKAHISVQLLFLQILEGARLYDKFYEKYVSFEDTVIIFTTNCGKGLYQDSEEVDLSGITETEILDSLREDKAFPQELCSRFAAGSIIMFNHLQPYYLRDIVKQKMDTVTKDLATHYKVNTVSDQLLPELFLFQAGSGLDARVASARSGEFVKDLVISFVKDMVQKNGGFSLEDISIRVKLNRRNEAVHSLFVNKEDRNVLVISDNKKFHFERAGIHTCVAQNSDEALRILREKTISMVLLDLTFGAREQRTHVSNAMGIESVGRQCFDLIRSKAPQLPLYVVAKQRYKAEDKKAILKHGARGLFAESSDANTCFHQVQQLLKQLHMQASLKQLRQKGQCLDYRSRYFLEGKAGVIELYDLSLMDIGMDDAALRRKSKQTKVFDFERPTIRFQDIVGAGQAKKDFKHFINYIQNIDKYVLEGAETPKGVLLYGPPGTGKTSLAKALAGECEALFLNTTGANILNAENPIQEIKDLFQIAYANAPAILFIDEIDVIAKERRGTDTATEIMVNTLLTEMEGFRDKDPFKPVFVVAATNYNVEHQEDGPMEIVIDPAVVRRFDNPIYVGLPSREERKQYIQLLLEQKKYTGKITQTAVDYMAEHTGGRSIAFLKRAITNMTNMALDAGKEVNDALLTEVLETQLYGEKRENDEKYRLSVARHEAGHAYVSWKTNREPKFITIISRGEFGGYVSYGDGEDAHKMTKDDFLDIICQALAGRAAEVVYYGESGINTGASSDLAKATELAIKMICRFGMGNMGLLSLNPEKVLESPKGMEVLEEANRILAEQMERAVRFIKEGRRELDKVVDVLMDKSYIQGANLLSILKKGAETPAPSEDSPTKKHKWYVVINGRKPGIYTAWAECLEQVSGYSNAVYRAYETEELAKQAFALSKKEQKDERDKPINEQK